MSADPLQLRSAIANLIRNALYYSEPEAPIHVEAKARESTAIIVVSNRGRLSEDEQASIFGPFSRGTAGMLSPHGSGLGLFIAARIVEAHGGCIEVQSQNGNTSFSISVPIEMAVPCPAI